MPHTTDPYENEMPSSPDQGDEGNENRPNYHEGTALMSNHIATALAALLALLTATSRAIFTENTVGWTLGAKYAFAERLLADQDIDVEAAFAESACPVTEADRPDGHTGPLEQFRTILCDSGLPLREWCIDYAVPFDGTNVWIRRDDTFDGGEVVAGTPFVMLDIDGTQQYTAAEAEHLAATILAAAKAVKA